MTIRTQNRLRSRLHRLMLFLLLVAVPVYGASATLVGLLGVRHVHSLFATAGPGADPMAGWSDVRRAGFKPVPERMARHHSASERHHHGWGDTSVVALDGGSQAGDSDGGNAPAGSLAHVFALASVDSWGVQKAEPRWLDAAPARASRWIADGPERPPRT